MPHGRRTMLLLQTTGTHVLRMPKEAMLCSGDEWVGEGSTMPVKRTGIGSWITGNSAGVLQGVDCGDTSRVMMSSAL
jgi:hypothetical protein